MHFQRLLIGKRHLETFLKSARLCQQKRNKKCDFDSSGKLCSERLLTGNEEFWKQNTEPFPRQCNAYLSQKT